ncbi:retrovirus-related pol polyprotein from transposon TNT 1-94 [Tanacetum coccineum]
MIIKESLNVRFDKSPPPKSSPLVDDDIIESQIIKKQIEEIEDKENGPLNKEIVNIKESKDHPIETIIGKLNERTLRSQVQNKINFFCFVSSVEPKNVKESIQDESWTMAMQEELNQFVTNDVWSLVPPLENQTVIGTKWVFKNKLDENGVLSRNKARPVAQGYNQQEGINFDETYAPVARLESIRILLAYAYANDFKLFQMNVKSAFLNGFINEEVYVSQPLGFIEFEKPIMYTNSKSQIIEKQIEDKENGPLNKEIVNIKESKDHPIETIIGKLNERTLRSQVQNKINFFCFVSSVEPKNVKESIQDESWTIAMQEELNQFVTNDVWSLVPPLEN